VLSQRRDRIRFNHIDQCRHLLAEQAYRRYPLTWRPVDETNRYGVDYHEQIEYGSSVGDRNNDWYLGMSDKSRRERQY
jgi:hypothetical protein